MRLQDLLSIEKRRQNATLDDLVERSTAAGYPVSRKTWHRWLNENPSSFPDPETMIGFHHALRISQQEILDAAAESMGVNVQRVNVDRSIEAITSMIQDRSAEHKETVVRFVRSVVRTLDEDDQIKNGR